MQNLWNKNRGRRVLVAVEERPNGGPESDYASVSRNDRWSKTWTEEQEMYEVGEFSEAFGLVFGSDYVLTDGGLDTEEYTDGLVGAAAEYANGTVGSSDQKEAQNLIPDGGENVEGELEKESPQDVSRRLYGEKASGRGQTSSEQDQEETYTEEVLRDPELDAVVKRVRTDEAGLGRREK